MTNPDLERLLKLHIISEGVQELNHAMKQEKEYESLKSKIEEQLEIEDFYNAIVKSEANLRKQLQTYKGIVDEIKTLHYSKAGWVEYNTKLEKILSKLEDKK